MTALALEAVLFDFDGTLVDSAAGLAAATNAMLSARGRATLPLQALRPAVGSGARGMIGVAFGLGPADAGYAALRDEFLERYALTLHHGARLFDGVAELLLAIERRGLRWGIVTNKALRFAEPLANALGLQPHHGALVGGDTTPHTKPHPAPLLEATRRLQTPPQRCVYVGDDLRDMLAGRAAGMRAWAAAWGYLGVDARPSEWPCDGLFDSPQHLLQHLEGPAVTQGGLQSGPLP
jgi:phosphoglycolate phosphatase